jgi:hypothetical protein
MAVRVNVTEVIYHGLPIGYRDDSFARKALALPDDYRSAGVREEFPADFTDTLWDNYHGFRSPSLIG